MTKTTGASLVCCLGEVTDPRKPSNGTLHDFLEILVIAISAVLSDCDTIEDMAEWGRTKEAWLREFLVLRNGVPSEKTFLRIFQALDPKQFEAAFRRWVSSVVPTLGEDEVVAIDGKASRRTGKVDATPRPRFMPPLRRYAGYLYKNNTRSLETTVRKRVR